MAIWNITQLSEIKPDRCDAEYFRKDYLENINLLKKTGNVVSLGRLFKYVNRGTQPQYCSSGTIKALRSVNVGFMSFNETRQEYVTEDFCENSNRGLVQKDDILITSTGVGTLGRTSIWYKEDRAFCDGHITILRSGCVNPYFITAFLNSKYGLLQFDQNYRGSSGQIEIYPYDISKFIIPECLFLYQEEISSLLKLAFEQQKKSQLYFDEASNILQTQLNLNDSTNNNFNKRISTFSEINKAKRFDAQCFKPEFLQYELSIRNNYRYDTLFSLLNYISKGSQQITNNKGNVPYVSIKDISGIDVLSKAKVITPCSNANKENLLLAVTGATIGKIGIIYRYNSLSFSGDVVALSVNKDKISPWYLLSVLSSPIGQTQFNRWITGSTNGHLSPMDINKIIVPRIEDKLENKIESLLIKSIDALIDSETLLSRAKNRIEEIIENSLKK